MNKNLIIAFLIFIVLIFLNECGQKVESYKGKTVVAEFDSTRFYKDKYGREHAVTEKLLIESGLKTQELDKISKELDVARNKIKGLTKVKVVVDTFVVLKNDSFYRDREMLLVKQGDTVFIKLEDSITIAEYWKRSWFLGKKRLYVDAYNTNKFIKLKKIEALEIKLKDPKFILGPSMTYDPINNRFTLGVSIIYYPFTLKF